MRPILLSLAGLAAVAATACTTVVPPAPQVVTAAPVSAKPSQYCREYTSNATVDGRPQETVGTACLGPDGTWRIVDAENSPSSGAPSPVTTDVPQTYAVAPAVAYPAYPYPYPYPAYAYYPAPYYPYPYYGPAVGIGLGFRFGGGHRH